MIKLSHFLNNFSCNQGEEVADDGADDPAGEDVSKEVLADEYAADAHHYSPEEDEAAVIVVVTSGIVPKAYPGAYGKAHCVGRMGAEEAVNVFLIYGFKEVHAAVGHFGIYIGALPFYQKLDEGGKLVQAGEGARTGQHHYQALFPTQSIDKESYDYQIHRYPY